MQPPRSVVIIGGGTAGWMSAVYLNRALGPTTSITLAESPQIGTIGVGEASFNTLKAFFDYVGLDESEWMPPSQASYKLGIKFVDWTTTGRSFFHPFQRYDDVQGLGLPEWWLHNHRDRPFDRVCFTVPAIAHAKRAPKTFDGSVFETRVAYPYAYHFDAGLLAAHLREVATRRGVSHVQGTVKDVDVDAAGMIARVRLDADRSLEADLFIDCTGFRGVLTRQALGEDWLPFSSSLFCDRALAVRIPHDDAADGIRPYTTSTALSSGWVWDIPLKERTGTGYVYSGSFLDDDSARQELRRHLGRRLARDAEPNLVRFRCGRLRNSWVGNCVALGLSSSFVEPLESTAIFTIQHGLLELINHLPAREGDDRLRASYNRAVNACVDGIRDFLIIHYYCNDRRDTPFWEATKRDTVVPDELRERLEVWRHRLPNPTTVNQRFHGFYPFSYTVMMLGMSGGPAHSHPLLTYVDPRQAEGRFAALRARERELCEVLPRHDEYLDALYQGRLEPAQPGAAENSRPIVSAHVAAAGRALGP